MAELEMETRPIGVEDIGWDTDGSGDTGFYEDGYGSLKSFSKINAGHIPLPKEVRSYCGNAKNIAGGMLNLASRIDGSGSGSSEDVLNADTVSNLYTATSFQEKQAIINGFPRNLGGHTLIFCFQEAGDETFSSPLVFSGFYNGKLIIDLNSITIYDSANAEELLKVESCFCYVKIQDGSISHTHSPYGVKAENSPSVNLSGITFTGPGVSESYAFYGICSDGVAESCVYNYDDAGKIEGQIANYIQKESSTLEFITMNEAREDTGSTGNLEFGTIS